MALFWQTRLGRWTKWPLISLAALVAFYAFMGFLVVPWVVCAAAPGQITKALGRPASIGAVRINPFALSLSIQDLRILDRDGGGVFLSFGELRANLELSSLFHGGVVLSEAGLVRPVVRVTRNRDGSFNFSDLLAGGAKPAPAPAKTRSKPLALHVENIHVDEAVLVFKDEATGRAHTIRGLNFSAPTLLNLAESIENLVPVEVRGEVNGAALAVDIKTRPFRASQEALVSLRLRNLQIVPLAVHAPVEFAAPPVSGRFSLDLDLASHVENGRLWAQVSGHVSLDDLVLAPPAGRPLVKLPKLAVVLAPSVVTQGELRIESVRLLKPEIRVERGPKGEINLASIVKVPPAPPAPPPPPPPPDPPQAAPFSVSVGLVEIAGGRVEFTDRSTPKPFQTTLSPISLALVDARSTPGHKMGFRMDVATSHGVKFHLEGEARHTPVAVQGLAAVNGVRLSDYEPYYGGAVPFAIRDGVLGLGAAFDAALVKGEPRVRLADAWLALKALSLARKDKAEPFFTMSNLDVRGGEAAMPERQFAVARVRIEAPYLRARRDKQGAVDLASLAPPPAPAPAAPPPASPSEAPFAFALGALEMAGGRVDFADDANAQPFRTSVHPIDVEIRGFRTTPGHRAGFKASLATDGGEAIRTAGDFCLDPIASKGAVVVTGVPLRRYAPYYSDRVLFDLDGVFGAGADWDAALGKGEPVVRLANLSLALKDLALRRRGEAGPFLSWALFAAQGGWASLAGRDAGVGEVALHGLRLRAKRDAKGVVDLARLTPPPAAADAKPEPEPKPAAKPAAAEPPAKPWTFTLGKLLFDDLSAHVRDEAATEPANIRVDKLRLALENFSTKSGVKGKAALSFVLNDKGSLAVTGEARVAPLAAEMKIDLKDIGLAEFQGYLPAGVNARLRDGRFGLSGALALDAPANAEMKTSFKGKLGLEGLHVSNRASTEDFLKLGELSVTGIDADVSPLRVRIAEVKLSKMFAPVVMAADGTINLTKIAPPAPSAPQADPPPKPAGPPAPKPDVAVERIVLEKCAVDFTDNTVKPPFVYGISDMDLTVAHLALRNPKPLDITFSAKAGRGALISVKGQAHPMAEALELDLATRVQGVSLPAMSPYSAKAIGYDVAKGDLALDVKARIEKGAIDLGASINIAEFSMVPNEQAENRTALPVGLAIALLKNRKGEIRLSPRITGDLKDPDFHIASEVVKFLLNLVEKAATAPFALLGALLPGGESLEFVEFDYGSAEPSPESAKKLDLLAQALDDRPELKVEIEGYVDMTQDSAALRKQAGAAKVKDMWLASLPEEERAAAEKEGMNPEVYRKFLEDLCRSIGANLREFPYDRLGRPKLRLMELFVEARLPVAPAVLKDLAQRRAANARAHILAAAKIEPERVTVVTPESLAPKEVEGVRASRISFRLKQ
ncbi:MAG TPA: DUF748 domain-containing protein [Candidatus Brocadiia bacterium]|nr:DUF748 domain-containing protein [Candidatus Brocadiia bacterium]